MFEIPKTSFIGIAFAVFVIVAISMQNQFNKYS